MSHRFAASFLLRLTALAAPLVALGCGAARDGGSNATDSLELLGPNAAECPIDRPYRGAPCTSEGLLCAYGYQPRECGGTTYLCDGESFSIATTSYPDSSCRPAYDPSDGCAPHLPDPPSPSDDADAGPLVGGECAYTTTPGYLVITSIEEAPASDANCSVRPRQVRAAFYDASGNPVRDERITVSGGMNPPESCLEGEGLRVGAHLAATMHTIAAGTCNPLFVTLDAPLTTCERDCW